MIPQWLDPGTWTPLADTAGAVHISCSNSAGGGPAQALKVAEVVSGLENTRPRRGEAKWSTGAIYSLGLFGAAFLILINHPSLETIAPNNPARVNKHTPKEDMDRSAFLPPAHLNCQGYPPALKTRHTMAGPSTATILYQPNNQPNKINNPNNQAHTVMAPSD